MRYLRSLIQAAVSACAIAACGSNGPLPPPPMANITGTVRNVSTNDPLPGATVSAAGIQATTDATGRFDLTGVPVSPSVTISAERAGFVAQADTIVVQEGANTHDIWMTRESLYELPGAAVYVPPVVSTVRGVILYLAGGDTRALATDVCPFPDPVICDAQRQMRDRYLALASARGLAIMGTEGLTDAAASDARVLAALETVAERSARPELADAPLLINGASGGAPEGYGLTRRQPDRVIGFMVIHGTTPSTARSSAAQQVPGYVLQAEFDPIVDPAGSTAFWVANRAEGALWAFAVEPGATYHFGLTARAWSLIGGWINTVLSLRLPATVTPGAPVALNPITEASGWLGNRTTFTIAAYADYADNPLEASWFPTQQTAQGWQVFVTPEVP